MTVSPTTAELASLGATVQLTAEVRDQNARVMAGATLTWSSGDTSVATVNASGLVTGVGEGVATITASAASASGSTMVTVTQPVADCPYATYAPLMERVSTVGPLCVTGSARVPMSALHEAGRMLAVMLADRGDVGSTLRGVGALTGVFARTETVCDLPYFADLAGRTICDRAAGGLGGVPGRPATGCSEKNVLQQPDDPYGRGTRPNGENVCVHEVAHTIMNVGLSDGDRARIRARFAEPDTKTLWAGDYALENADEFFAEMAQAYFCANPEDPTYLHHTGVNCAAELEEYDPATYELIHGIFKAPADLR